MGTYPGAWCLAKVFTIFKKGVRSLLSNYRAISILSALCKLYECVLNRGFTLWYRPYTEQACAQEGRGCSEKLLLLRLIIDIARKTGNSLYILFVDFEKAYDKVSHQKLLTLLTEQGCGAQFLSAIANTLKDTDNIIGSKSFKATAGVRQGGATSCSLFTFYVNAIIRKVKEFGPDGFLYMVHLLMLMDDTVIFTTSRRDVEQKLALLMETTVALHMSCHPVKSKFMTVNKSNTEPFIINDITILYTDAYVYLGSPTSNTPMQKQVADHMSQKKCHVRKFSSFLQKNSDAPYSIKKLVWNSTVSSAVMYSCESWWVKNLGACTAYLGSIKELLGVRTQTLNDTVCAESKLLPIQAFVKKRQVDFLKKVRSRPDFETSPLKFIMDLAVQCRSPMGKYLIELDKLHGDPDTLFYRELRNRLESASSARASTYRDINSDFSVHPMYQPNHYICELHHIATTRLRLSSHRLRIETGRWSRIPREERLCSCGENVQTESHVLLQGPQTTVW